MSQKPYRIDSGPNGVVIQFDAGVRIRLIGNQDPGTGRWKVRLPWGVSIDPKLWPTIAGRASWCYAHAQKEARNEEVDS